MRHAMRETTKYKGTERDASPLGGTGGGYLNQGSTIGRHGGFGG